jgi:hypothetical protein
MVALLTELYLIMVLIYFSPMVSDVEHVFKKIFSKE